MNVENLAVDEETARQAFFIPKLGDDLVAICASQVDEITRLNQIIVKLTDHIESLTIDNAFASGKTGRS